MTVEAVTCPYTPAEQAYVEAGWLVWDAGRRHAETRRQLEQAQNAEMHAAAALAAAKAVLHDASIVLREAEQEE